MPKHPHRCAALPIALLLAASAAQAAPPPVAQVTQVGRSSVNHIHYYGGFAISGDEGEDGAPAPVPGGAFEGMLVTDPEPRELTIAGSDYYPIEYLFWTGFLAETWKQTQTYAFAEVAGGVDITASGSVDILQTSEVCSPMTGCDLASEWHRSTNTQALDFTLSTAGDYTLAGSTTGAQWVDLLTWNAVSSNWSPIVSGVIATQDTTFDLSGTLGAGRYRISNRLTSISAGGLTDVQHSWNYTLSLPDATLAPVPEPSAAALLCTGLLCVGWLARRRRTDARSERPVAE